MGDLTVAEDVLMGTQSHGWAQPKAVSFREKRGCEHRQQKCRLPLCEVEPSGVYVRVSQNQENGMWIAMGSHRQ